jgi:nitroreductase/ferredoxin
MTSSGRFGISIFMTIVYKRLFNAHDCCQQLILKASFGRRFHARYDTIGSTLHSKPFCRSSQGTGGISIVGQITVNTSLCKRDGACVAVCPSKFLSLNKKKFPEEVADGDCILCGHCVAVCAYDALAHAGLPEEALLPACKELPVPAVIDSFLISRRSVREFKSRPIARETLEALLDVARRAPTASNSQKLHWIVVQNRAKVHALSTEAMKWLRSSGMSPAKLAQWESGYDFVLHGAPTVVVACAPADYGWGKQDCAIALTFLELAAEVRGLGVCWAGYLTRVAGVHAPLRQALSIPEGYVVCGGLMLGERKYSYRWVPPRKPLSVQWV